MAIGNLEQIGVEAVVEGLSSFLGDINQVNGALDKLRPQATLLQQAFGFVGDTLSGFADSVVHVAEYALGGLLKDAIEGTLRLLGDLIATTIQAGSEFQTLELRLQGMNLDALMKSGMDYNAATQESIRLTQVQFEWLQKLAATTPYDLSDISNVYTLARTYGFADDQAKTLTEDTLNFSAAMGISKDNIDKITYNFGQMIQRGKITSTEMRDLARGSFLPLGDILDRISKKLGITVQELTKQISTPEGVPAQLFIDAFQEMVAEEPRFQGAAVRMAKTFKAASDNALDMVKSIGGLNIVKPILDVVGAKISGLVAAFTDNPARWQKLVDAGTRVGETLSKIVGKILDLVPSAEGIADGIVKGFNGIADWLDKHQDDIVSFIQKSAEWVSNVLLPKLIEIGSWFVTNWPTITSFIGTIGSIIADLVGRWFGGMGAQGGSIGDAIVGFMQFVIDHKDEIVNFLDTAGKMWLTWEIAATIIGAIVNAVITLIGLMAAVTGFIALVGALGETFLLVAAIIAGIGLVLSGLIFWVGVAAMSFLFWKSVLDSIVNSGLWKALQDIAVSTVNKVQDAFRNGDWFGIGIAIISGIINGLFTMATYLYVVAADIAANVVRTVNNILGIHSPSKIFTDIGENTMLGMAQGIEQFAGLATAAMTRAVSMTASPAVLLPAMAQSYASAGSTVNNSSATTYNQNLTIHSNANTEPIISDFGMMRSLAGG